MINFSHREEIARICRVGVVWALISQKLEDLPELGTESG